MTDKYGLGPDMITKMLSEMPEDLELHPDHIALMNGEEVRVILPVVFSSKLSAEQRQLFMEALTRIVSDNL